MAPGQAVATHDAVRRSAVRCRTTDTHGRVLLNAREHHFVGDGPAQNGCPGEALTPVELFLSGVAACGTYLMQVIARDESISLERASVCIDAEIDVDNPIRPDMTLFTKFQMRFTLAGVNNAEAERLVGRFRQRCPLYGSIAIATPHMVVEVDVVPGGAAMAV